MPLVVLILTFVVVGVLLWLINSFVPMEAGVKRLMNIAVIVVLVLWLLRVTGLLAGLGAVRV